MVTKSTESKKGGSAYVGVGNDGYRKYAVTLSTGMLDNGWAFTFSGALNTGDGYIRGTNYEGWTYFGNISKKINDSHKLSLTAFGVLLNGTINVQRSTILKIIKIVRMVDVIVMVMAI